MLKNLFKNCGKAVAKLCVTMGKSFSLPTILNTSVWAHVGKKAGFTPTFPNFSLGFPTLKLPTITPVYVPFLPTIHTTNKYDNKINTYLITY